MRKILFLLLLFSTCAINAQVANGTETKQNAFRSLSPQTVTSPTYVATMGADGTIGRALPDGISTENRVAVNDVSYIISGTGNKLIAYTAITADRTVTLPSATTPNQRIWITDESGLCSNARRIIVQPNGSDTIGGDVFSVINFPNGSGYLESNGAGKWNIISTTSIQFSAGVNTLPSITDNGNGSVTIGNNGVYSLFANTTGVGRPKAYQIAGGTFTLVDGSTNYIYAEYNTTTGAVSLQQTTTETPLNDLTQILVYAAYRQGMTLHPRNFDTQGIALSNKLNRSIYRTQRVRYEEGGVQVGESASPAVRTITITGGTVWVGATEQVMTALTSAANTCYHVIQTSPGVWTTSTVVTQYNNTQYNTTAGLQTLVNNDYGVNWVYRSIGTDNDMAIILGGASYTLGQAQASAKPTNLPPFMRHMELIGRIIVQKNSNTATQIDNVSVTNFSSAGISDHNALLNVQQAGAGVTNGHLSDAAQTIAGVKTFSSSPIVPTPTTSLQVTNKSYVDAGFIQNQNASAQSANMWINGRIRNNYLELNTNQLNEYITDNDSREIAVNYTGYNGGITRFRDFNVYNGKQNSILYIKGSTGNVGIGTTNPMNKFQSYGGAITVSNEDTYSARFSNNSDKGVIIGYDTTNNIGHIGSINPLVAWTPLSINTNGGNVLIGTTTDNGVDKLQVNGSITASAINTITNLSGTGTRTVVADASGNLSATATPPARPYLVYTALISQSGTSDPVATVLENTLGGTIAWVRTATGRYTGTITGSAFTLNKTWVVLNSGGAVTAATNFSAYSNSTSTVIIQIQPVADSVLNPASIEIRVYP